jgi:uncharacterized membrane protein (UPF0127 family)
MRLKSSLISVFTVALLATACGTEPSVTELTITGKDKTAHVFSVEIADDAKEQERGLMGRQELAADHGMLFIFPKEHLATFWMKNTPLFLDMLFIDDKGKIVHIHPLAKPFDETVISTPVPARAVLEIKGGEAKRQQIEVGATLNPPWHTFRFK